MTTIERLADLSALTSANMPPEEAVGRALPLLEEGLGADEVSLVYGDDRGFRRFGTGPALELTDIALWLVHRDLTTRGRACAFDMHGGRVEDFRSAGSKQPCQYMATLVSVPATVAGILLAHGSWSPGFSASRRRFLEASLPALALLLERRLVTSRAERQRTQLSALANINQVMSDSEDPAAVLKSIAGTIATVTRIDYVSIDLVDTEGSVTLRCMNSGHKEVAQLQEKWERGASRPDPVRDAVLATREPLLFPDAQQDARIPEAGRHYFARTLIRSTATFPLLAKDEVLGVLSVASHRPLDFVTQEVELLEGLAGQVATAVKGIRLYQELAKSREELQYLNAQLQESMGIEHHLARTDDLTGIPNRRFIDETVATEVARARRYGEPLSVVLADLDNLKEINDRHGHQAGDEASRLMATIARDTCRESDVVARYGGDEFLFVVAAADLKDATVLAERFRRRLAGQRLPGYGSDAPAITISLGAAQWDASSMDRPDCLISQADAAMYAAKNAGRNRTMLAAGDAIRAA